MSVHKSKPWELDVADLKEYQDVLPVEEDVQIMFPGWGHPANKFFLSTCKHDFDPVIHKSAGDLKLKKTLARSKKRYPKLFDVSQSKHDEFEDRDA